MGDCGSSHSWIFKHIHIHTHKALCLFWLKEMKVVFLKCLGDSPLRISRTICGFSDRVDDCTSCDDPAQCQNEGGIGVANKKKVPDCSLNR